MLALFSAVLSIVVLIAFFYLVHLVSHIRNGMRMQSYFNLIDRMNGEVLLGDTLFNNMRILGVITKVQQRALEDRLESNESV